MSAEIYHKLGNEKVAVYATIKPTKDVEVPYWCNTLSAYNDSPPTGYMSLKKVAPILPVAAKYSLQKLVRDKQDNIEHPLEYYGTVLSSNGRIVKYDPDVMTGKVHIIPEDTVKAALLNPEQKTNTGIVPKDLLDKIKADAALAKSQAEKHPLFAFSGVLMLLFGMAVLGSIKKK